MLASYSMTPAKYETVDGVPTLSDERTYVDDGKQLQALWIISLIFVIAQCLLGCFSAAPPTQDKLRKDGLFIDDAGDLIDKSAG